VIKIEITCQTSPELIAHITSLSHHLGIVDGPRKATPAAEPVKAAEPANEPAKETEKAATGEAKGKRGRPSTSKPDVETTATKAEPEKPAEKPAEEDKPAAKEDVADITKKVSSDISMDKAREILAKFETMTGEPCRRISDIMAEDYDAYVKACKEELEKAKAA
jgi:hypothetical protein